jgi:outer membrane receptor protein involved in Fe transport
VILLALWAGELGAAETAKQNFDLPADAAATTLKLFSAQSGHGVIVESDLVKDVRTTAVRGAYSPVDAVRLMLAGTGLVASQDEKSSAFTVARKGGLPNAGGAGSQSGSGPLRPNGPSAAKPAASADAVRLQEYVVTGVFTPTSVQQATASISTIASRELSEQVPVSAADLLLNVPGVFVNSSLGEIRGMVYSRGVSVNTSDGSNGYYYVSMQEDGLPITNVNLANFGPDYFLRPDATLLRVEAVRGGSASITATNSPGGAFNYISKTGTPQHGGEIRTRFGLEGRSSPFYRGDLNLSGPVGRTSWLYNVGGFYRQSDGHRPPSGYPMNDGGSIRGSLFKDYGSGSIKIYGKYHDDRNHWFEYLLALNPENPKQAPGLTRFSNNLLPNASHAYPREAADQFDNWDNSKKAHSMQRYFGAEWKHEFRDGWSINNNVKISRNQIDRNTSANVTPLSLAWPGLFSTMGIQFSGGTLNGRVPAGTYQFRDRRSGDLVGEVTSNGNFTVNSTASSNPGQVVTFARVPNGNLEIAPGSFNAIYTVLGSARNDYMKEVMEQFSITKRTDKNTFTAGGYFGYADISVRVSSGGRAAMPLVEQPDPLAITWIPATAGRAPAGTPAAALDAVAGWNGQPVQITNPNGYTALGVNYSSNAATAKTLAAFFGHKWEITKRWSIDWGMRSENYAVKGVNRGGVQNPRGNWDPTYGGADGSPLTMYDNRFTVPNPANVWNYNKNVDSFSLSIGTNVVINERNSIYLRHTDGEKAPDFSFFQGYNSTFRINNLKGRPQTIEQWEIGYRYNHGRLTFTATPFWSRLGDITTNPQATEADGVTLYYPDPIYNVVTSYGVELEGTLRLTERLSARSAFAWQESEGTVWKQFFAGVNGRDDDRYRDFSGKRSDNNPDFILRTSVDYRTDRFFANLAWKHMGERAGNVHNVIILPRFNQFDLSLGYNVSRRFSINFNINNLTDSEGVMTWRGWGVNPGDRQGFEVLPSTGANTLLQYIPIQPRAYFVSATYKL